MFWNNAFFPRPRRHPLMEVARMGDVLQQMLTDGTRALHTMGAETPVNIWQQPDAVRVALQLPGVSADALDIAIEKDLLTVKGAYAASAPHTPEPAAGDPPVTSAWLRSERPEGEFERTVTLPFPVDAQRVTARMHNGILWIDLPRAEADKPRKIPVQPAATQS